MSSQQPRPILKNALRRQVAALPQGLLVTCDGDSMAPTLRRGEKVRVRAVPVGAIGAGDVILFELGDGEVELHRVIARLPRGRFVHRGDAADATVGVVRAERIIGRADLPPVPPRAIEVARAIAIVTGRRLRSSRRRGSAARR